jgi:hypothetical protein
MTTTSRLLVFGQNVHVSVEPSAYRDALLKELALYPAATGTSRKFFIHCGKPDQKQIPACPRNHGELEHGFVMKRGFVDVYYDFGRDDEVHVTLDVPPQNVALRWRGKLKSMQYAARDEYVGQMLHELALVPLVHFAQNLVPIHASGMVTPSGRGVAIGGTGGVGKTSLELELCLHRDCAFLADDISVLDAEGRLWPNYNFPKIYAYNALDNPELEKRIFQDTDKLDRLQFAWHARKGPTKARRRLNPERLFPKVAQAHAPLGLYLILLPVAGTEKLRIRSLDHSTATSMTLDVLADEFGLFQRHLRYHGYNRKGRGMAVHGGLEDIVARWKSLLLEQLARVDCAILEVPAGMPHPEFKKRAADLVLERAR